MVDSGLWEEWERKQVLAGSMVDFLEGWIIRELCLRFRTMAEALYSETYEQRLLRVLLEHDRPLSLREIASKSGVSRALVLRDGRVWRAIERLERSGIVLKSGGDDKPRYSLDRRNLASQLMAKVFEEPSENEEEGLVEAILRESIGPQFES
ncbi:MAG: winged helix-turn-helix domain-containing protein [Thaumarchaeota archaeon]|nr:winged helix-turn-helix domain-containing protein [Nitrososphaerota archaeon]